MVGKSVSKLGFWSAVLSFVFAIAYIAAQIAEILGYLGPPGGPTSLFFLMFPSFFLPFSFVILAVCIHHIATADKKIFSQIGIAFSIIYSVLILIVYYTQLTLIIPNQMGGTLKGFEPFLFTPFNSFLFGLDVLGYGIMNLATLFFAFVFERKGPEKRIWWFLFLNGIMFPTNMLSTVYPPILFADSTWAVTFPVSMILLAVYFKRKTIDEIAAA